MIAAFALALLAQAPAAEAVPDEAEPAIVVTGTRRGRCRVQLAQRSLSDRELGALAREWATLGRPVTVIRPAGADYRCLARIAFRLQDQGVRLIRFVDRGEVAATPRVQH